MEKQGLMDKPAQIYNFDKVGVPLNHRPPHFVVRKGQTTTHQAIRVKSLWLHVLMLQEVLCQLMLILLEKNLNLDWTEGEIPRTTNGLSSNGWVDMNLLQLWFTNHFLLHAVSA